MKIFSLRIYLFVLFLPIMIFSENHSVELTKRNAILIKEAFNFQFNYGSSIWNGWNKQSYPLLFKTSKIDYLLNHPDPPKEFKEKYYDGTLKAEVFYKENIDTNEYQAAYPINGIWAIVISEPSENYNAGLWLLKFAHESFHIFQFVKSEEKIINPFTNQYANYNELNFPFDYDNELVKSAMRIEAELVFKSSTVDSISNSESRITQNLFSYHQKILKKIINNENCYKYKQWIEWNEGVARYTERELAKLIKDKTLTTLSSEFLKTYPNVDFNEVWEENYNHSLNPIRFIGEGVKGRVSFYYSGMGKAYYLDKINKDWKEYYFKKSLDDIIANQ